MGKYKGPNRNLEALRPTQLHSSGSRNVPHAASSPSMRSPKKTKSPKPPKVSRSERRSTKVDKEPGAFRKLGRAVLLLTIGAASLGVLGAGGYAVSKFTGGEGVDLGQDDEPKDTTNNSYQSVTGAAPPVVAPVTATPTIPETIPSATTIAAQPVANAPQAPAQPGIVEIAGTPVKCASTVEVGKASGEFALTAQARAAGQPLDRLISAQANAVFEQSITNIPQNIENGLTVEYVKDINTAVTYIGYAACTGFELIPE